MLGDHTSCQGCRYFFVFQYVDSLKILPTVQTVNVVLDSWFGYVFGLDWREAEGRGLLARWRGDSHVQKGEDTGAQGGADWGQRAPSMPRHLKQVLLLQQYIMEVGNNVHYHYVDMTRTLASPASLGCRNTCNTSSQHLPCRRWRRSCKGWERQVAIGAKN